MPACHIVDVHSICTEIMFYYFRIIQNMIRVHSKYAYLNYAIQNVFRNVNVFRGVIMHSSILIRLIRPDKTILNF